MKRSVFVLVSLAVAVLIGVGYVFTQDKTSKPPTVFIQDKTYKTSIPNPPLGPKWKLVFTGPNNGSTVYVNTRSITHLPKGIVKVWILGVPRGGFKRTLAVNFLKNKLFSEGKNPNDAERFWYYIHLDKFNCKKHKFDPLEGIYYSFGREVLYSHSFQSEKWYRVPPGGAPEIVEKYVCNETPSSIPEPSLAPEWKLIGMSYDRTTVYFNTRVTHLPGGIVKFWELWVPRGEFRREKVNALKKLLLYEGKNPNDVKRFWYETALYEVNCKKHQFALLGTTAYSFGRKVLYSTPFQSEKWHRIVPGNPREMEEKYVCK